MESEKKLLKRLVEATQKQPKGESAEQQNTEQNQATEDKAGDTFKLKTIDEIIKENERTNPSYKE